MNHYVKVTSHTGCVSRNMERLYVKTDHNVTSHTGCVSRNSSYIEGSASNNGHIPHGMCE